MHQHRYIATVFLLYFASAFCLGCDNAKTSRPSPSSKNMYSADYDWKSDLDALRTGGSGRINPLPWMLAATRLKESGNARRDDVRKALIDAAKHHDQAAIRAHAVVTLEGLTRYEDVQEALALALQDKSEEVRAAAEKVLAATK